MLAFVVAALALGAWIYQDSIRLNSDPSVRAGTIPGQTTAGNYICKQQYSTYMAFIVDSIAVVYLLYITWDEYSSKPLGLRSFNAKMRLIFLDLLFIVFSSANLSLAFNTLSDQQWACYSDPASSNLSNNEAAALTTCVYNKQICQRQQALCAMLLLALAAWLMTFSISVLRYGLSHFIFGLCVNILPELLIESQGSAYTLPPIMIVCTAFHSYKRFALAWSLGFGLEVCALRVESTDIFASRYSTKSRIY